jgi:hypothetical protein
MSIEIIDGVKTIVLARTKECDIRKMFPHLCESCASKVDRVVAKVKSDAVRSSLIAEYYAKVNAERKEQIGTNG